MRNTTLKASSLLLMLLTPFLSVSPAQADSVDEWAYWNASPQFAPENFQYSYNSNPNPTTAEQTRIGNNQGVLAEATTDPTETGWVGYSLITSGSTLTFSGNKGALGDIALVPVNEVGEENDRLLYADSGPASILLNLSGTGDETYRLFFPKGDGSEGAFEVVSSRGEKARTALSAKSRLNLYLNEDSFGTKNDSNQDFITAGSFYLEDGESVFSGLTVIGKLMPISNIAVAVAAVPGGGNLIYRFDGISALRSPVNITVNFTQASWNGLFGSGGNSYDQTSHSGYSVLNGTISGNTLTGNVTGGLMEGRVARLSRSGTVISGQVTGRLVGELGLNDIGTAGIIGKSTLTVAPATMVEARTALPPVNVEVNDIFMLGGSGDVD